MLASVVQQLHGEAAQHSKIPPKLPVALDSSINLTARARNLNMVLILLLINHPQSNACPLIRPTSFGGNGENSYRSVKLAFNKWHFGHFCFPHTFPDLNTNFGAFLMETVLDVTHSDVLAIQIWAGTS